MRFALAVALGVLLTGFISICFEFGNGNLFAGVSSARGYLTVYGFAFFILAGIAAIVALLVGRLIGITITSAIVLCFLFAITLTSYTGSKAISRFRKLVWAAAPSSLPIHQHEMQKSFSDGTTYTFVITGDARTIAALCRAANLTKVPHDSSELRVFSEYFPDGTSFSAETEFYRGGLHTFRQQGIYRDPLAESQEARATRATLSHWRKRGLLQGATPHSGYSGAAGNNSGESRQR